MNHLQFPPSFTLRQLAYFLAAADFGTIAEAAIALRVSPSAMSDAITELETLIGDRLCVRRRAHGLVLTPAGELVAARARRMLSDAADLERSLGGDGAGELAGPIVIGCYPTLVPSILPPLLHEFGDLYPNVELSMFEGTVDQLEGTLESGKVDVAFVYDTVIPGNPRRLRLYELSAYIVLPADHHFATRSSLALEELVDEPLILLDAPPSSAHTMSLFAERGLHPNVRHVTGSFEAVRTLVGRGLGYGVLVQRPSNSASYEGFPLVMIDIEPLIKPAVVDIIWPDGVELPSRTRALIEFCRDFDWPGASPGAPAQLQTISAGSKDSPRR